MYEYGFVHDLTVLDSSSENFRQYLDSYLPRSIQANISFDFYFHYSIGAINFEYENIELKYGEIEKQSGELKAKWGTKSKVGN